MNSRSAWLHPVMLEGQVVQLQPLTPDHVDGIWAAANHPELWTWMPYRMTSREDVERLAAVALLPTPGVHPRPGAASGVPGVRSEGRRGALGTAG